jgi:hypothetical protein
MGCGTTRGNGFSSGIAGSSMLGSLGIGCSGSGDVHCGDCGDVGCGTWTGTGGKGVTDEPLAERELFTDIPPLEATSVPSSPSLPPGIGAIAS